VTREQHIAALVKDGMPPDLAPRALDSFLYLLESSREMIGMFEKNEDQGFWMRYGFMQGFVAGSMASVHHN